MFRWDYKSSLVKYLIVGGYKTQSNNSLSLFLVAYKRFLCTKVQTWSFSNVSCINWTNLKNTVISEILMLSVRQRGFLMLSTLQQNWIKILIGNYMFFSLSERRYVVLVFHPNFVWALNKTTLRLEHETKNTESWLHEKVHCIKIFDLEPNLQSQGQIIKS